MPPQVELQRTYGHDMRGRGLPSLIDTADVSPVGQPYASLTNKLMSTIVGSVSPNSPEARVSLFTHNETFRVGQLAEEEQTKIRDKVSQVVTESTQGVHPGSAEGRRISEMAPALADAILKSTLVDGIQSGYVADVARFAIEASRDPNIIEQTVIRTGFGGSEDDGLTMRFAAYALPALELLKRLGEIQKQRESRVADAKVDYIMTEFLNAHPDTQRTKEKKREISAQLRTEAQTREFTQEEERLFREQAGCFALPKVEFFFAPYSGIVVNGMDSQKVLKNAQDGARLLEGFVQRFYPEAKDHISFRSDAPKSESGVTEMKYTGLVLEYFSDLLEKFDGEEVNEVLDILRKRGLNHNNGEGHAKAELYSALHPLLFRDKLEIPSSTVRGRDDAVVNITIGGRPERLFNEIRRLLSEHSSVAGFQEFVRGKLEEGEIDEVTAKRVDAWAQMVESRRAEQKLVHEDLPLITLPLITNVGAMPVYYATVGDIVMTPETVAQAKADGLDLYMDKHVKTLSLSSSDKSKLKSVVSDVKALLGHVKEDELLAFYEEFLAA